MFAAEFLQWFFEGKKCKKIKKKFHVVSWFSFGEKTSCLSVWVVSMMLTCRFKDAASKRDYAVLLLFFHIFLATQIFRSGVLDCTSYSNVFCVFSWRAYPEDYFNWFYFLGQTCRDRKSFFVVVVVCLFVVVVLKLFKLLGASF